MGSTALQEAARKMQRLKEAEARTQEAIRRYRAEEQERENELGTYLAFTLDNKMASQTELARTLGMSRDKMNRLAGRSRQRTQELLRKGTN